MAKEFSSSDTAGRVEIPTPPPSAAAPSTSPHVTAGHSNDVGTGGRNLSSRWGNQESNMSRNVSDEGESPSTVPVEESKDDRHRQQDR